MLSVLCEFSHKYGSNPDFVLAGGGNTSAKDDDYLYIKGSGSSLATIKPEQFVKMDRAKLASMWQKDYPAAEDEREAAVLADKEGVLWAEGLGTDRRAAPGPHSRRVALIRIEEDLG